MAKDKKQQEKRIKVRVLRFIPVWPWLVPVVGKVYDAIEGNSCREFCVIDVAGKKIVLRNVQGQEPEYEVLESVG